MWTKNYALCVAARSRSLYTMSLIIIVCLADMAVLPAVDQQAMVEEGKQPIMMLRLAEYIII